MNIVVDTSVWSLLLRREHHENNNPYLQRLRQYLNSTTTIHLIGPVLCELLDGLKSASHFDTLLDYFKVFPCINCDREDYIEAARLKNTCRSHGVQAGIIDFLIGSVCISRNYPLLTADRDFTNIAKHCTLHLIEPVSDKL